MARPRRYDLDVRLAVAYLSAQKWPQTEIAQLLDLTPATVSKFVTDAKRTGRLTQSIDLRFNSDDLRPEQLQRIRTLAEPSGATTYIHDLAEQARQPPPSLRIFAAGTDTRRSSPSSSATQHFGAEAAEHLLTLLGQARICGVSWGATLKTLVDAIAPFPSPRKRKVLFIPVAGEPLGKAPTAISASTLAQRLDELINGDVRHRHSVSLAGVPAFVPINLAASDLHAIDRLFGFVEGYHDVFGSLAQASTSGPRHIDGMDMLLTSIGPLGRPFGPSGSDFLRAARLDANDLGDLAVAEVSGVLLEHDHLSAEQKDRLDTIRARWRGIRIEHLAGCARRARTSNRPGVILVALGKDRMRGVIEVVKRGLANHILIDHELAVALNRAASRSPCTPRNR